MKTLKKSFKPVLVETLNKINNEYPSINDGGCGEFALALYSILNKIGYKVDLYMLFRFEEKRTIKQYVKENNVSDLNRTDWRHVIIKVGNEFIDSTGVCKGISKHKVLSDCEPIKITLEFLKKMNSIEYYWNYMYDRKLTPKINKKLKNSLVD